MEVGKIFKIEEFQFVLEFFIRILRRLKVYVSNLGRPLFGVLSALKLRQYCSLNGKR